MTSALCLCPSKTSNTATTRSGTDMPSTWRGQASCRKSPWWARNWTAHQVSPEFPFFIFLHRPNSNNSESFGLAREEPLKLKKPWPLQLSQPSYFNCFETPQLSPQPVASGKALQPSEAMRLNEVNQVARSAPLDLVHWLGSVWEYELHGLYVYIYINYIYILERMHNANT